MTSYRIPVSSVIALLLAFAPLVAPSPAAAVDQPVEYYRAGTNDDGGTPGPFRTSATSPIVDNLNSYNRAKRTGTFKRYGPAWLSPCGCGASSPSLAHQNGYNGCYDYITSHQGCGGYANGSEKAVWRPRIPVAGDYEVWVSFVCTANRSGATVYQVHHAGGTNEISVNQAYWGCGGASYLGWANLGIYHFARAATGLAEGYVSMAESERGSDGSECADAAGFRPAVPVTLSGTVTDQGSGGTLPGVTVSAGEGLTTVTDATGSYSFTLPFAWSGTVTPALDDYVFQPASRSYTRLRSNRASQDFTGIYTVTHDLTGTVTVAGSGAPLAGVTVSASLGSPAVTDAGGVYRLTLPGGWSGSVTPSLEGYAFQPPSRTFTSLASDQTGQDFTASPAMFRLEGKVLVDGDPGRPLSGVAFQATGGLAAISGADGAYLLSVPWDWTGTVTPSLAGAYFSPPERFYYLVRSNQTGQDFSATITRTYLISGTVTNADLSLPAANVRLATEDGREAWSDDAGQFSLEVPQYWTGTLTPLREGFSFAPPSRSYENVQSNRGGQNFSQRSLRSISGTVRTAAGGAMAGVTVDFDGGTTYTDVTGRYSFPVPYGWSGSVYPSRDDWWFDPGGRSYDNVTIHQFGQDYTGDR
jgi:hypothetical protein